MTVSEKTIEAFCVKEASIRGGKAIKGTTINTKGFPDRIIVLPGGRVGFLELKRPGKKPTALQAHWIKHLQTLGCVAGYADTKEGVIKFMDILQDA